MKAAAVVAWIVFGLAAHAMFGAQLWDDRPPPYGLLVAGVGAWLIAGALMRAEVDA